MARANEPNAVLISVVLLPGPKQQNPDARRVPLILSDPWKTVNETNGLGSTARNIKRRQDNDSGGPFKILARTRGIRLFII